MLTARQLLQLRRAGLRIEENLGTAFIAILDRPTRANPFQLRRCIPTYGNGSVPRDDLDPIELPFVAFCATRRQSIDWDRPDLSSKSEWTVAALAGEPNEAGIHYVPQLDTHGQDALAFLEAFVASLE